VGRLARGKELRMESEEKKELIRRRIAFSNTGFSGALDTFIAADYVGHLGDQTMDLAELEEVERAFAKSFPDMPHAIDDILAEHDRVVLRVTSRGTHRIAGYKIAESWGEIDFLRLMRPLRSAA
jgi:predicted ester cyclase